MTAAWKTVNLVLVCSVCIAVFCLSYFNLVWYNDVMTSQQHPSRIRKQLSSDLFTDKSSSVTTQRLVPLTSPSPQPVAHTTTPSPPLGWIYAITPTYRRPTQVVDLTSLCHTLQLVEHLVWIVIEDHYLKSDTVRSLLSRCKVQSVHLVARNISEWVNSEGRGVEQRNAGLRWIRENCAKFDNCNGSFYFMDDDNKYALELFHQIREVQFIGMWPVGYAGYLKFEGPVCIDNKAVEWHALFAPERIFPLDMAAFAVNVHLLLDSPGVLFGYDPHSRVRAKGGWQETRFLENFTTDRNDTRVECRGSQFHVFVWHIQTGTGIKTTRHNKTKAATPVATLPPVTWLYDLAV